MFAGPDFHSVSPLGNLDYPRAERRPRHALALCNMTTMYQVRSHALQCAISGVIQSLKSTSCGILLMFDHMIISDRS